MTTTGSPIARATLIMIAPVTAIVLGAWACRVRLPIVWDYGPAQLAISVNMLAHGISLYRDFRVPPYIPMVYGPLVPYVTASLLHLFGAGAMAALEAGRLLVILSTLVVCLLIFRLAQFSGASNVASLAMSLAFVASPLIERWGFEFRVDMPSIAFQLGGLYLVALGRVPCAAGLFLLGSLAKQNHLAGIAAAALYLLLEHKWRALSTLLLMWCIGLALLTGAFQLAWPWYWFNTVTAVAGAGFDLVAPFAYMVFVIAANPVTVALAISSLARKRTSSRLVPIFALCALVQDFGSSLRWGSSLYYFIPTLTAASILAAPQLDEIFDKAASLSSKWQFGIGATMGLALLISPFMTAALTPDSDAPGSGALCPVSPWNPRALNLVERSHGTILTDTGELALVTPSSKVQFIDLMILDSLHSRGLFNDGPLIDAFARREVAAVVLDRHGLSRNFHGRMFFWPELREAIARNYVATSIPGPPLVMLPKPPSSTR